MSDTLALNPMRQAFASRYHSTIDHVARTAELSTLKDALSNIDSIAGLSVALEQVATMQSAVLDPLAAAKARGITARKRLIERAGGLLRLSEAAKRLGVSSQAVTARRSRGTILAVQMPNGEWVYPVCQFTSEGLVPGLIEFLQAFQHDSAWTKLNVLLAPSTLHDNRSPLELLAAGETAAALNIAGTYGEQG